MTDPEQTDGRLVAGRYRLRHVLGRGGMGAVWAAYDEVLRRKVAVKEVSPSHDLTPEQRDELHKRTMREARAAARLTHPSVVTVYDVVEDGDRPWIVMELLPPRTLADVLTQDGPMTPSAAARIGLDVLGALRTAHRVGVLHRDVKPANVILSETGRAVLTDFGIATVEGDPALTLTGMLVGSPGYMSPERARGERPTAASDLWSLGATLYAVVEGDPPFRRSGQLQTLFAVISEQPPQAQHAGPLREFIAHLLDRDPLRRPSASEAFEQLRRIQGSTDLQADRSAPPVVAQKTVVTVEPTLSTTKPEFDPGLQPDAIASADQEPAAPPEDAEPATPPEDAEPTTPTENAEPATPPEDAEPTTPTEDAEPATPPAAEAAAPSPEPTSSKPAPEATDPAKAGSTSKAAPVAEQGPAAKAQSTKTAAAKAQTAKAAKAAPETATPAAATATPARAPAPSADRDGEAPPSAAAPKTSTPKTSTPKTSTPKTSTPKTPARKVPATGTSAPAAPPPATPPVPLIEQPSRRPVVVVLAAAGLVIATATGLWAQLGNTGGGGRAEAAGGTHISASASGTPTAGTVAPGTVAPSTVTRGGPSGNGSNGAWAGPTAITSGAQTGGPPGASTPPPWSGGNPGGPRASAAAGIPVGFRLHNDPTGFSVAVPSSWTRSVQGTFTYFREPGGRGYLMIDQTTQPKADVVKDWQAQESSAGQRFPGYRRVRLERIDYRGWQAADWEFTWQPSGGPLHVMNRNIRPSDRRAYALYWSVPAQEWGQRLSDFEVIAGSFQPAS